jgi:hypothetical protein
MPCCLCVLQGVAFVLLACVLLACVLLTCVLLACVLLACVSPACVACMRRLRVCCIGVACVLLVCLVPIVPAFGSSVFLSGWSSNARFLYAFFRAALVTPGSHSMMAYKSCAWKGFQATLHTQLQQSTVDTRGLHAPRPAGPRPLWFSPGAGTRWPLPRPKL